MASEHQPSFKRCKINEAASGASLIGETLPLSPNKLAASWTEEYVFGVDISRPARAKFALFGLHGRILHL